MMAKFFQPMLRAAVRNSLVVAVVGNGMCRRRPISEMGRAEDVAHGIRVTLEKRGLQKEPLGVDIIVVTKERLRSDHALSCRRVALDIKRSAFRALAAWHRNPA